MADHPILFSAAMIRALLAGTKTQTRRVAKFTNGGYLKEPKGNRRWHRDDPDAVAACPYGEPGDLLWVRETCRAHELTDAEVEKMEPPLGNRDRLYGLDGVLFTADEAFNPIKPTVEAADAWVEMYHYRGKRGATVPPIHMPRWASRLTLRITDVRVQRLQEISEADAMAEGVPFTELPQGRTPDPLHVGQFSDLWESINGPESWHANPWVWALTFEVIKANIDEATK